MISTGIGRNFVEATQNALADLQCLVADLKCHCSQVCCDFGIIRATFLQDRDGNEFIIVAVLGYPEDAAAVLIR